MPVLNEFGNVPVRREIFDVENCFEFIAMRSHRHRVVMKSTNHSFNQSQLNIPTIPGVKKLSFLTRYIGRKWDKWNRIFGWIYRLIRGKLFNFMTLEKTKPKKFQFFLRQQKERKWKTFGMFADLIQVELYVFPTWMKKTGKLKKWIYGVGQIKLSRFCRVNK